MEHSNNGTRWQKEASDADDIARRCVREGIVAMSDNGPMINREAVASARGERNRNCDGGGRGEAANRLSALHLCCGGTGVARCLVPHADARAEMNRALSRESLIMHAMRHNDEPRGHVPIGWSRGPRRMRECSGMQQR